MIVQSLKQRRRNVVTLALVLQWMALWTPWVANAEPVAPNVVVILADDMGWNDVGFHGSEITTPNIDRLAAEGIELNRFYAQPSCSPTRAGLMTGRSPQSLGIYSPLSKLNPTGLALSAKLMPEYFRDAGYQTLMVGKWHLGFHEEAYRPNNRGFDHFYGNLTGGIGYWDHVHGGGLDWQRNGETLREEGYATHLISAEIDRLLEQRDVSKPVFLYAAFNAPHLPNEAPATSIASYSHIAGPNRPIHAAMVTELDNAVGRILSKLAEQDMLDNTLVWFMSDNGGLNASAFPAGMVSWFSRFERWLGAPLPTQTLEWARANVLDGAGDNSPFRKGKLSIYEGGTRVPSVVYWGEKLKPAKSDQMITVLDVMPTLLAAADIRADVSGIDGVSYWQHFLSGSAQPPRDFLITARDGEALYRFPWKLLALKSGEIELYRLDNDPEEATDVASQHPDVVRQLSEALREQPRAESVHVSAARGLLDPDTFGGEEDREPWSELAK